MKRLFWILSMALLAWSIFFLPFSHSIEMDPEVKKSYMASDYVMAAKLLEQHINQIKGKALKNEKVNFSELYMKYIFLAQIYMRKLNRPDDALSKYQEAIETRRSSEALTQLPQIEFLYIAEIYEGRNDLSKAMEYYQALLKGLESLSEKPGNDHTFIMAKDLTKFIKYQIDGLNLKARGKRGYTPLLKKLKLSSQYGYAIAPLIAIFLVPTVEYGFPIDEKADFAHLIREGPTDLASMIQDYVFVLAVSAGSVNESSEKAMDAYLSKFPEGYYSLPLRYLFCKFYRENGETKKAERYEKELKRIADKRGMEIIVGPDRRFSSPEKTWETYRQAMKAGDTDTVMDCFVPVTWQERQALTRLGKEKMREIGDGIGNIEKVTGGEKEGKFRIRKKENDKEISYYVYFDNIDGEWRMRRF